MTRNERYLIHYKAQFLARLVGAPQFPRDYLSDGHFHDCVREVVPGPMLGEPPHAAGVVAALEHEAAFRKGERRPIGFGHGASATQTGSDS